MTPDCASSQFAPQPYRDRPRIDFLILQAGTGEAKRGRCVVPMKKRGYMARAPLATMRSTRKSPQLPAILRARWWRGDMTIRGGNFVKFPCYVRQLRLLARLAFPVPIPGNCPQLLAIQSGIRAGRGLIAKIPCWQGNCGPAAGAAVRVRTRPSSRRRPGSPCRSRNRRPAAARNTAMPAISVGHAPAAGRGAAQDALVAAPRPAARAAIVSSVSIQPGSTALTWMLSLAQAVASERGQLHDRRPCWRNRPRHRRRRRSTSSSRY